jgi:hypothetical protein
MRCRKNLRKLIQAYQAAAVADRPGTALMKLRGALVALKAAPSRLPAPHAQANRYDDYVYIHQQSMAGHATSDPGPHPGHKGPAFFPWHRELLRQLELDLRAVAGDPTLCLPYWDWSRDQQPSDPGYPFIDDFLGGNGVGSNHEVATGVFAHANGWTQTLGAGAALQRDLGAGVASLPSTAAVTGALAVSSYDASPWNWDAAGPGSFRNLVEGWIGPESGPNMHNRVHVWVGGSMLPSTSPNDPVFFFNHTKEDELWAVWTQKYPAVSHYLPLDSEPLPAGHTHLKRLSDHMESLSEYFGAGTIDRPIDLIDHKAITWYDTDLPDLVLESGPAVVFDDTPAGLTVGALIRFRIQSCRPVTLSITGAPTGNFSVVGGPDFTVTPLEANDFETLEVEVRFHAVGAAVQVGALDLEARIVDEDGYYAAHANDSFTVARFHIDLVASNIVTSDSSIVLVLDRSGSMSDVVAGGRTKHQLLASAVGVLHGLMQDTDEIGIARFDHEADVLLPMTVKSAGLGTALTGTGLDPRGATSIGAGILVGSGLINGAGATRPNKAMLVLTDGNENTLPLIAGLPAGTIDHKTFAIGFGQAGQVSDPILSQISANTGGYLLVTGDLTSDTERFRLAKLFIQILKDATLGQTVLDPGGLLLGSGAPQEIAFPVADSDVSVDVVVLCPVPRALDFRMITPGGQLISPAMSGIEPNVRYVVGAELAYYRLMLPALPSAPSGSHRGTWRAVLQLQKRVDHSFAASFDGLAATVGHALPFNLSVHTYSNLTLDATLQQDGFAPGAPFHITASLREYRVPLRRPAVVTAELTQPDGTRTTLALTRGADLAYHADGATRRPGIYQLLIRATGYTSAHSQFTREKLLTAGVWAGGDRPYDPPVTAVDPRCTMMRCLLEHALTSELLRKRSQELGLDLEALYRCLISHCHPAPVYEGRQPYVAGGSWEALLRAPQARGLLALLAAAAGNALPVLEAATTTPVVRKPRLPGSNDNMFDRPKKRG